MFCPGGRYIEQTVILLLIFIDTATAWRSVTSSILKAEMWDCTYNPTPPWAFSFSWTSRFLRNALYPGRSHTASNGSFVSQILTKSGCSAATIASNSGFLDLIPSQFH